MSQSAVSGALRELESQFDILLFDRVGKRLQINETGYRLRPQVESLMAQAQQLATSMAGRAHAGELKVGATLTIGNYLCVGLIDRYMKASPDSRVHLDVANTQTIVSELLDFKIDLGMIEGELQHPELSITPWQEDELVCFCAPDHALASGVLTQRSLLAQPWILREPGSGTRQTFERALNDQWHEVHVQLELQHTEAIKRAVEAKLGIACLSRIALKDAFARGSLVPIATPWWNFRRNLYLVLHRHKYLSAGIRHWISVCHGT